MSNIYRWLWTHTTGQPWTWIMRSRPLLLVAPLVLLVVVLTTVDFKNKWLKSLFRVLLVGAGIILGHVFW